MPGALEINDFSARNTETNQSVKLSATPLVTGPVSIKGAELPDTNSVVFTNIPFDADNSNINAFISSLANEITYDVDLTTNFNGNPDILDNFITDQSAIDLYLDFRLPLVGLVEELILVDTVDLDAEEIDVTEIESGTLRLVFENQFPVQVRATAKVFDVNGEQVDVLAEGFILNPGIPTPSGYVSERAQSVLENSFTVDE